MFFVFITKTEVKLIGPIGCNFVTILLIAMIVIILNILKIAIIAGIALFCMNAGDAIIVLLVLA